MPTKVLINNAGKIIEYGDIANGVAYNVTSPKIDTVVAALQVDGGKAQVGAGSPEGATSTRHANDLYLRTSNNHLFVHAAASGNTGWVDATAAAAPSGPTTIADIDVDSVGLADGELAVWDATNKRFKAATPVALTDLASVIALLQALGVAV
jgi:hypothetical protein